MFTQRKKGVGITDKRIRLTTEVLQGIRLIKFYAWEEFYSYQIGELRGREIKTIRKAALVVFYFFFRAHFADIGYFLEWHVRF
jgi:ATP-binding cassette subfamily C (CFTR/MRP) protein 1